MSTALVPAARAAPTVAQPEALRAATQLLLVTTPSWSSPAGTARRYERRGRGAPWDPVGPPFPVRLGRAGLGWSSDAGAPPLPPGAPQKREGDGRSPAGAMRLGELWGYAPTPPAGVALPYRAADALDRCVDDAAAPQYNQLLRAPPVPPWRSAEQMLRQDDLYRHLIVVRYNMERPVPGAGSCIFLHLWDAARSPTAGCTSMGEDDLLRLARWLDPARQPVLVQLPADLHRQLRASWGLPPVRDK